MLLAQSIIEFANCIIFVEQRLRQIRKNFLQLKVEMIDENRIEGQRFESRPCRQGRFFGIHPLGNDAD